MHELYLAGVSQISKGNQSKAIDFWELAAKQGCLEAIDSLINIYRYGHHSNIDRALFWAKKVFNENPERYKRIIAELKQREIILGKDLSRSNMPYSDFDSIDQGLVVSCLEWGDQMVSDYTEIDPD
ncbi:hypothetical protein [Marinobacter sp. BSs20148]|uniref:hypothetical protein n=1 Tax=Marinobacter sp. BSs20148 TaxID=490759 RepID=UPI0005A15E25|nr:hypothetical protein [Marinobacter sp. BSs20148]